mgnify:CR=1 FL=1
MHVDAAEPVHPSKSTPSLAQAAGTRPSRAFSTPKSSAFKPAGAARSAGANALNKAGPPLASPQAVPKTRSLMALSKARAGTFGGSGSGRSPANKKTGDVPIIIHAGKSDAAEVSPSGAGRVAVVGFAATTASPSSSSEDLKQQAGSSSSLGGVTRADSKGSLTKPKGLVVNAGSGKGSRNPFRMRAATLGEAELTKRAAADANQGSIGKSAPKSAMRASDKGRQANGASTDASGDDGDRGQHVDPASLSGRMLLLAEQQKQAQAVELTAQRESAAEELKRHELVLRASLRLHSDGDDDDDDDDQDQDGDASRKSPLSFDQQKALWRTYFTLLDQVSGSPKGAGAGAAWI